MTSTEERIAGARDPPSGPCAAQWNRSAVRLTPAICGGPSSMGRRVDHDREDLYTPRHLAVWGTRCRKAFSLGSQSRSRSGER